MIYIFAKMLVAFTIWLLIIVKPSKMTATEGVVLFVAVLFFFFQAHKLDYMIEHRTLKEPTVKQVLSKSY